MTTASPPTTPEQGAPGTAGREPILQVRGLVKHFPLTQGIVFRKQVGAVQAVDGVYFDLSRARRSASSASPAAASPRSPSC